MAKPLLCTWCGCKEVLAPCLSSTCPRGWLPPHLEQTEGRIQDFLYPLMPIPSQNPPDSTYTPKAGLPSSPVTSVQKLLAPPPVSEAHPHVPCDRISPATHHGASCC